MRRPTGAGTLSVVAFVVVVEALRLVERQIHVVERKREELVRIVLAVEGGEEIVVVADVDRVLDLERVDVQSVWEMAKRSGVTPPVHDFANVCGRSRSRRAGFGHV